jgi:choloylglycine hydrolase
MADACLTFRLKHGDALVYGRNFDWAVDVGAVIVNRRNVRKTAFVMPPEKPLSWMSVHGSVTFNQFSREVPVGGMNEHGLVMECLVSKARHPKPDERKTLNELQWIQYHLDTCKTVDEVLASAAQHRISPYAVELHYFLTDASGKSAVIEFLDGKLVQHSGAGLPQPVLANSTYAHSLRTAGQGKSRFARAAGMVEAYRAHKQPVEYAFTVLDRVSQGTFTKWQVVYDIPRREIHFRSLRKPKMKTVVFKAFDFDTLDKTLILDINAHGRGLMTRRFQAYTEEMNNKLMDACLAACHKEGMMRHVTPEHVAVIRRVVAACKAVDHAPAKKGPADKPRKPDKGPSGFVIDIAPDGELKLLGRPVTQEELAKVLQLRMDKQTPILIRAHKQTLHKDVRKVMDMCAAAGLWRINFKAIVEKGGRR